MIQFVYLCTIIFIIIFILFLTKLVMDKCPKKIKRFYLIVLTIMLMRYLALMYLLLTNNERIVYKLLITPMMYIIYMPMLALGSLYIFFRDEKMRFDYSFAYLIMLSFVYLAIIVIYKLNIHIDSKLGYIITFKEAVTPSIIYLSCMSIFSVITLLFVDKPYSNNNGMRILLAISIISVGEFILFLGGIKVFPYPIFSEILMLLCTYKAINTFKKIRQ